jgi:hypothetical protein
VSGLTQNSLAVVSLPLDDCSSTYDGDDVTSDDSGPILQSPATDTVILHPREHPSTESRHVATLDPLLGLLPP